MTRARSLLLRLTKKNNQKGFTLIELLVVISILGILAAVVTMSMVGITKVANDNAAQAELQTVRVAYDTMLSDQQATLGNQCPTPGAGAATNTMTSFPPGVTATYASGTPAQQPVPLSPNYLHQKNTKYTYFCDSKGVHPGGDSPAKDS
jgi:prepilin-type N-terminal cleavage/methylation domain-containing protein